MFNPDHDEARLVTRYLTLSDKFLRNENRNFKYEGVWQYRGKLYDMEQEVELMEEEEEEDDDEEESDEEWQVEQDVSCHMHSTVHEHD